MLTSFPCSSNSNSIVGLPPPSTPARHTPRKRSAHNDTDWGFEGYMTSDSDSCACIKGGHPKGDGGPPRPTNGTDATKQCLLGGTDIDSGGTYRSYLAKAVEDGELDIAAARTGLRNSYKMRMMMGLFDPTEDSPYKHIPTSEVGSEVHQAMSLLGAKKSMTLLKNDAHTLPFARGKRIAVIGQSVSDTNSYTGNYDGPLCPKGGASCFPNLGEAVNATNTGGETVVVASKDVPTCVKAATAAEQVILMVDNFRDGGGEGKDRYTIGLSAAQLTMAQAVIKANPNTVLVMINGGVISIDELKEEAPAILEAWMPGVHGGEAMAATIFGDNNPGGKMPVTMYPQHYVNVTDFLSMSMVNRTYKYYTGTPLYPFGYGLSYTTFSVKWSQEEEG